MCGCGKKNKIKTYVPQFRQVMTRDRLGRVIVVKVPIPKRKHRMPPKNIVPDIQPKIVEMKIEDAIDSVLNIK